MTGVIVVGVRGHLVAVGAHVGLGDLSASDGRPRGLGEGYDWVECGGCGAGWQVPHYAESVG